MTDAMKILIWFLYCCVSGGMSGYVAARYHLSLFLMILAVTLWNIVLSLLLVKYGYF